VKVQQLLAYLVSTASGAVKGLKGAAGQLGKIWVRFFRSAMPAVNTKQN